MRKNDFGFKYIYRGGTCSLVYRTDTIELYRNIRFGKHVPTQIYVYVDMK